MAENKKHITVNNEKMNNDAKETDAKDSEKDKEKPESKIKFDKILLTNLPGPKRSLKQQFQLSSLVNVPATRTYLGDNLQQNINGVASFYRTVGCSFHSEILVLDFGTGEMIEFIDERLNVPDGGGADKDELGTQRVYKKTSPNCALTMYLPSREITLAGQGPSILHGIIYVDPKSIEGYRIYAQLTLTFRYGREDEEVMGLRFCNEAIMSLHQVWPRHEEPVRASLSPLQEALVKRLGEGAHPFTLSLTSQAPPSVQLVPAKRYYGAPIGTSYDVRCFIADKTDEKFHRRASVKMGVRVIYRTDVLYQVNGPENFAALINSHAASPPITAAPTSPSAEGSLSPATTECHSAEASSSCGGINQHTKPRKSERGESFPKLRLSPKAFRFSGRFGRSKSEIEKNPSDSLQNYSKSFQEYESCNSGGGPQGAVDKPFLLQDGRVGLRARLDKAWYTHGENVSVTINIRNDSRKTVRKIRVCAIQHVDVCMFNNGKFKNVVADSDANSPPVDHTVPPGGTLNCVIVLNPRRGHTKNWIALEDTLQRSTEPDEITGAIAASAIRSPNYVLPAVHQSPNPSLNPQTGSTLFHSCNSGGVLGCEDRNVFAIYVSYYVKVKLTLSGMGGELSLKLPFVLVHVDEYQHTFATEMKIEKLALDDVPASRKNTNRNGKTIAGASGLKSTDPVLDRIESADEDVNIQVPTRKLSAPKRRLVRSETIAKDLEEETGDSGDTTAQTNSGSKDKLDVKFSTENGQLERDNKESTNTIAVERDHVHVVQIHSQAENFNEKTSQDTIRGKGNQAKFKDAGCVSAHTMMSSNQHNSNV